MLWEVNRLGWTYNISDHDVFKDVLEGLGICIAVCLALGGAYFCVCYGNDKGGNNATEDSGGSYQHI